MLQQLTGRRKSTASAEAPRRAFDYWEREKPPTVPHTTVQSGVQSKYVMIDAHLVAHALDRTVSDEAGVRLVPAGWNSLA